MIMDEFLLKMNEHFNNKNYDKWYIDDLFWNLENINSPIANLIKNYFDKKKDSLKISDEDAQIIIENYNIEFHILIKSILDYMLACSKYHNVSNLEKDAFELIDLYFDNIKIINGGLPIHNLSIVLKLTIKKFPTSKKKIRLVLFEKLINGDINVLRYISFADYFIRDDDLKLIFTIDDYEKLYNYYFVTKSDEKNISFYLDVYERYLDYLTNTDKNRRKTFLKKYCDFVIENVQIIDIHYKHKLLPLIRDYMDELKLYSDESYNIIDSNIEIASNEMLNNLQSFTVSLPEDENKKLSDFQKKQYEKFITMSNADKVDELFAYLTPFDIKKIKKNINASNSELHNLFSDLYLDEKGKPINYKKLNENQMFSLKAKQQIDIFINFQFYLLIDSFFKTFKIDDFSKEHINSFLVNNELVSDEQIEDLSYWFIEFFKTKFRDSVYDIIEEFEASLRYYFENQKMNIFKRNGTGDLIGLSTIFNDNKNNPYRDKLYEVIDEDFYFTLKWLLVDEYGLQLRHKITHRFKSKQLYQKTDTIFAVLQIIRFYMGYQNR